MKVRQQNANGEWIEHEVKISNDLETERQKLISEINAFKKDVAKKYGKDGLSKVNNALKGSF